VQQRGKELITPETRLQLDELKKHMQRIPGVFLDERHQYSIRAFIYRERPLGLIQSLLSAARSAGIGDGALAPVPTHVVHQLLADLRLDRLAFHHTSFDTHIMAKEVNKGIGLVALRDWVFADDVETIAVGDGEPDLAMFRVASRSFAPANIGPRRQARLLGCNIVPYHDQLGLLEIARKIIHPADERCERCDPGQGCARDHGGLFLSVLQAADRKWSANFRRAVSDPKSFRLFIR
jgi:hypothetical protein